MTGSGVKVTGERLGRSLLTGIQGEAKGVLIRLVARLRLAVDVLARGGPA